MSLRTKILLLFLTLAIAPLLTVAGAAYLQSERALSELVRNRVETAAVSAARDLSAAVSQVGSRIDVAASDPEVVALLSDSLREHAGVSDRIEAWAEEAPPIQSLAIHRTGGVLTVQYARPQGPREPTGPCPAVDWSTGITISRAVRGAGGQILGHVTGTIPFDALFGSESLDARLGNGGTTLVVDRARERLLHMAGCNAYGDAAEVLALARDGRTAAGSGRSTFTFHDRESARFVSVVELEERDWTVVVTGGLDGVLAPFRQLQRSYGAFVILVALSTALAFSLLINRFMRSLEDLSSAADRIGEGDMSPWLPPPGEDEVGRLSLAIGRMAERIRQMMRQIERSGRMAVIGELASYLAHEIRNPLSSIKLNLQSLSREVDRGNLPEDTSQEIEICLREVRRLERVVTSVLKLGRGQPVESAPGSLHRVVGEAVELVTPELERAGVSVDLVLRARADTVAADFAQMKGVFLNLLFNAVDAMPAGGVVRVRSEVLPGPTPHIAVRVIDPGTGVPLELRDRIFEPFFSTKADGSGIGLSLALQTVEDHGGSLYLEKRSSQEEGTVFVVELPLLRPGDRAVGFEAMTSTEGGSERTRTSKEKGAVHS